MHKKKKVIYILFTFVLVLLIIFLVYKIGISAFAFNAIMFGEEIDKKVYYESPNECITHSIENLPAYAAKGEIENEKSIYTYENEKQYVEFFIDNHNSIWCYILDKKLDEDNKTKYIENAYEINVQRGDYYWHNRSVYHYKIVDDKKKIDNYEDIKPDVKEFYIESDTDRETLYLLFIADDE